jgi:hypothetical protein
MTQEADMAVPREKLATEPDDEFDVESLPEIPEPDPARRTASDMRGFIDEPIEDEAEGR